MVRVAVALVALAPARAPALPEELRLEARRRAFRAVEGYPGSHVAEVARIASLEPNHARYHLEHLERAGLVTSREDGAFVRYFPRTTEGLARDEQGAEEKRMLAALRKPAALRVALALLDAGPLALRDLAERLGSPASSLSYHLDALCDAGVAQRLGSGPADRTYAIAQPGALHALLVRYPPRRDLIASFVDLWDGLALPPAGERGK